QPAVAVMIGLAAERALAARGDRALAISGRAAAGVFVIAGLALTLIAHHPTLFSSIREGTVTDALARHRFDLLLAGVFVFAAGGSLFFGTGYGPESVVWRACAAALLVIAVRFGLGDRLEAEFNRTKPFVAAAARQVPADKTTVI